jgi:hypothetical protein
MSESERARVFAAKCLRMAKSARDVNEKHSWLAMAESWLITVQLHPCGDQEFQVTEEAKIQALQWAAQGSA